jgi:SNF2 family DNA or RNA helicase
MVEMARSETDKEAPVENAQGDAEALSGKFKTKPYRHQFECLTRFGRKQAFALLAEMGTGKSWIVINNVADLWSSGDCDGVLVFAPNGVHTNWTRLELPKHMPDWVRYRAAPFVASGNKTEKAALEHLYDGAGDGELRIMTMNWEALQHKSGVEAAMRFAQCFRRLMIVCDESDAAKNPKAERTKQLMKLKKYSHWRRIMTGTMINNAPFDAFSQFSFLDEEILGTTSYHAFKAEYSELLSENHHLIQHIVRKKVKMSDNDRLWLKKEIAELQARMKANGRAELIDAMANVVDAYESEGFDKLLGAFERLKSLFSPDYSVKKAEALRLIASAELRLANHLKQVSAAFNPNRLPQIVDKDKDGRPKYRNLDKLSALIAPHSYRVLKSECLDLPEKIYKTLFFDMTKEQERIYKKAEDECRIVYQGQETPFNKLVAVTKLAQITSGYYIHPLANEPVRIEGENPKLDMLVSRVDAIIDSGQKVIIWARYKIEIQDIVSRLEANGHNVVQYHGEVKKGERVEAIERFERGDAQVFVGNQQAGGTGITLVAASYAIYFSNDFSLRNRLQSEDRAHRIGQTKNVTYINICGKGTIDEVVVAALTNKQDVSRAIIDTDLFKHK